MAAPIVMVHGLLGFNAVQVWGRKLISYFHGLEDRLEAAGNRVHLAGVSPTSGIARRAEELRQFIRREVPSGPLHIIAHSMGGLDARYMISRLGMHDRVLSLTTLGTPHRGTPFADWGVRRLGRIVRPFLKYFDIPSQAFYDLTTDGCRAFNEAVADVPGVRYFAVAARCTGLWLGPEWFVPHWIINRKEGENDGLVSVASATYGEHTEVWDGDHLSLVNCPNPRVMLRGHWCERTEQYFGLVQRLADTGF